MTNNQQLAEKMRMKKACMERIAFSLAGILHEWTNLRQMVTLYDFVFKPLILEKSLYKQT